MQGSKYLKVTGILMIVFGAIGFVGVILALLGTAALILMGANSLVLYASIALSIVSVIIQFIAGIMGVKYCEVPEKAQKCFNMGIAIIALNVLSAILTIVTNSFNPLNFVIGLIIPVLFLIGASKNKASINAGI